MSSNAAFDRQEVIDTVNRIAFLADLREWDAVARCFAENVEVDYRSEFGGEVQTFAPPALMNEWKWLTKFRATQHDITSHVVDIDGDAARCRAHVRAIHFGDGELGESYWTCWGNYDYRLRRTTDGWKVERTQFTLTGWRGNPEMNARARGSA